MNRITTIIARNALKSGSAGTRPAVAYFATGRKRGGGRSGGSKGLAKSGPPPPAVTTDPWQPVVDEASGQTYYWNVLTDATTALGEPKPSAVTGQAQQVCM